MLTTSTTAHLASFALLLIGAGLSSARAVASRDLECKTVYTGVLSAKVNGEMKPFSLTADGALTYDPTGNSPSVEVEYQDCGAFTEDPADIPGIFRVPSLNKCISIVNQADETGPYFTGLTSCDFPTSYDKQFVIFTEDHDGFYFVGESDAEGSIFQGECQPGLLEVVQDENGAPLVGEKGIQFNCDGGKVYVV